MTLAILIGLALLLDAATSDEPGGNLLVGLAIVGLSLLF